MSIQITNKRICKFYKEHPTIPIDTVNLLFIDLMEKILFDTNSELIQSKWMTTIADNASDMQQLRETVTALKQSMNGVNNDITTSIINKMADMKREYLDEVRAIIQTNTHEKLGPLLEKNNSILIDKTALMMGDILPKNQTLYHSQLAETLRSFSKTISEDTHMLIQSVDQQSIKDQLQNFEMKSALMIQTVQQPLYSFITASEERIHADMNHIKESTLTNHTLQQKIVSELDGIACKFRDLQASQQYYDKQLISILTKSYNCAEITTLPANAGTLLMKRIRKTNVLICNKDSETNVLADDIYPFLQLIDEHRCNGVFISQHSGISTKKNYQIELHNGNIIVYLHNVAYTPAKIESAMDIIDNLASKLRQIKPHGDDDCAIPRDILDTINNEYQLFLTQKNAVIEVFKESQKKVLAQVDEIRFPSLDKFLSTKYSAPIQKPGLKCDLCKSFTGNNLKALAAHKRGCIRKHTVSAPINANTNANTIIISAK